jgi:hypothetical protein
MVLSMAVKSYDISWKFISLPVARRKRKREKDSKDSEKEREKGTEIEEAQRFIKD